MADVEARLSADEWRKRLLDADAEALVLEGVLGLVGAGASKAAALRAVLPDEHLASAHRRLLRFERRGRDGLIDRRVPVIPPTPMVTAEARGALRALAVVHANLGTDALAVKLSEVMGTTFRKTTVLSALHDLGMARPVGRPPRARRDAAPTPSSKVAIAPTEEVTPLPLAGCELLKAVDLDIGAIAALTRAMGACLDALPEPTGPVPDDSAHRDDRGRFEPDYNRATARTEPELGSRFETVEKHRQEKNLPAMRVAKESEETRARKNLGLVLLPCVVAGPRWSALQHWRGDQLGELIGYAYQSSTLDKYLRGLKFAGAAEACREAAAAFWLHEGGPCVDTKTGAVMLYGDIATKPVWTHHWTRCTKVSKTGRVMPAISTMTLHSGAGTPLVYRSWSGQVSLPAEVSKLLDEYERHGGSGTVRRVVVMDREAHSVALFKAFGDRRSYIVPLRENVIGPKAKFEDLGVWVPYGNGRDEVREAHLWLNDSRKGEKPLRVRVVGRKRYRTGKVAWYATNVPIEEFDANDVIRLYFERWPAQEHVYRDLSGVVGFDVHHGYGKKKVDNVAVVDRFEQLEGQIRRWTTELATRTADLSKHRAELAEIEEAYVICEPEARDKGTLLTQRVRAGDHRAEDFAASYDHQRLFERWTTELAGWRQQVIESIAAADQFIAERTARITKAAAERDLLGRRRQIFTVDVELDEIMTAFKFTFLNLCGALMERFLGVHMEVDTLIDAVLTLPGERVVTATTETIRIFRPRRDADTLAAVQRACSALNARALVRDERALRFEVAPPPDPTQSAVDR